MIISNVAFRIEAISEPHRQQALARLDTLTKPLGSLGRLESLASQLAAIRRTHDPGPLRKALYVFAADHGVAAEGVSAYPSTVTEQMVVNFLAGGAAINQLARLHQVALTIVDAGVLSELAPNPGLVQAKIAAGTRNLRRELAMRATQLEQALTLGATMADRAHTSGYALVAVGEMGIGNTTSASAITCALTGATAVEATGRGTGLTSQGHAHKIEVIQAALELHQLAGRTPQHILQAVGGLEIAAMTGFFLRAAQHQLILVLDGFIATAAAACAVAMVPAARGYMVAGHQSEEPGHRILLQHLALTPLLQLDMRLGEGTGAVLAMPLIESALALYTGMATFASAAVSEAT